MKLPLSVIQKIVFDYDFQNYLWIQVRSLNKYLAKNLPNPRLYLSFGSFDGKLSIDQYLYNKRFRSRVRKLVENPYHQIALHFLHYPENPCTHIDLSALGEIDLLVIWGSSYIHSLKGIGIARRVKLFFCSQIQDFTALRNVQSVELDSVLVPDISHLSNIHTLTLTRMDSIDLRILRGIRFLTLYNIRIDLNFLACSVEFLSLKNYYHPLNLLPLVNRPKPCKLQICSGYGLYNVDILTIKSNIMLETFHWILQKHFDLDYSRLDENQTTFYETDCPECITEEAQDKLLQISADNKASGSWLLEHPITLLQIMLIRVFQSQLTNIRLPTIKAAVGTVIMELAYSFDNQLQGWDCFEDGRIYFHFPMRCVQIMTVSNDFLMIFLDAVADYFLGEFQQHNTAQVGLILVIERKESKEWTVKQRRVHFYQCFSCKKLSNRLFCKDCQL